MTCLKANRNTFLKLQEQHYNDKHLTNHGNMHPNLHGVLYKTLIKHIGI